MTRVRNAGLLLATFCTAAVALISCGAYSASMTTSTGAGAPMIAQLVPNAATAGTGAFVMTVNGSGFGTDAVVYWNGSPLMNTAYVTHNQLMVSVPAGDVANHGTIPVYVRTGNMNSNTVDFMVN